MNIKYLLFALLGFFTFSNAIIAQDNPGRERISEKIKSHKVAFISEKLNLSEEEAQRFWPIYNQYQNELMENKESIMMRPNPDMNDAEAEKLMDNFLRMREKEIQIQRHYIQKFKTAIPPRKIAMLYKADREFKEEMVSRIKDKRQRKG